MAEMKRNFPDSPDVFTKKYDIQVEDTAKVTEFNSLWAKEEKTSDDVKRLEELQEELDEFLYTADDINHFQESVVNTQTIFLQQTSGFITNLQTDTQNYVDNKKVEIQTEIDKFKYKGVYNPSTKYYERNIVDFNDGTETQSYMVVVESVIGIEPTNNSHWIKLTMQGARGERGVDGLGLKFQGAYKSTTTYSKEDGVQYGGVMFASLIDGNLDNEPDLAADTAYWAKVLDVAVTVKQMVGTRRIATDSDIVNFMTGEIIAFNPLIDSLEVYKNSVRLTKNVDYTIGENGKSIVKKEGIWPGASEPVFFEFVVLKNVLNNLVFSDGSSIQAGTVALDKLDGETQEKINHVPLVASATKPINGAAIWFEEIV